MPEHDGLMRIFWPLDLPRNGEPGVIVGWRNSDLDLLVVTVLEGVEARNVDNALKVGILLRGPEHSLERVYELCELQAMHVLGTVNHETPNPDQVAIIATTNPKEKIPRIACAKAQSIQIIMYDRPQPKRMQYVSLSPISLALGDKDEQAFSEIDAEDEKAEAKRRAKEAMLVEKLKLHTVVHHRPSAKELALPRIINQINFSWELQKLLQKNVSLVGARQRRALSVSERVVESASTMRDYVQEAVWDFLITYIYPVVRMGFVIMLMGHRFVAEVLLIILEYRIRPDTAALKDVSATAQQVEIRLQQFCYWPMQYVMLRKRKKDWESITDSHPDYIRFYNSLWLVANDVIIGIALGSAIIDNSEWLAENISSVLGRYTVSSLQGTISWLMDWPAGLKLNNELAQFLGDLFLWVIEYWSSCVEVLRPYLPQVIWFIGFSSFAGASMPISLFSDLISALTLHIYSFYMASAKIFHWQLTIILSLFHLFRGKKHNVLRNRIDSCDYDLDQLLLGTILFTLLFFLLPTVGVFYLTFAAARMGIISVKAVLDTLLACLNHFPLFALMLRIKDSRRLPGMVSAVRLVM
jgi:phosphatidylinositol glycan class Q protein